MEAFPSSLRACWADSATSLELRVPFLADSSMFISGVAASRTKVCIQAETLSASFADFGSLDCTVLSSLGDLVYRVSGNGCFLFMLRRLSLGREQEKVSSTIFVVVADSFVISPSEASESASGCQ